MVVVNDVAAVGGGALLVTRGPTSVVVTMVTESAVAGAGVTVAMVTVVLVTVSLETIVAAELAGAVFAVNVLDAVFTRPVPDGVQCRVAVENRLEESVGACGSTKTG